jgi:hypothetical protein
MTGDLTILPNSARGSVLAMLCFIRFPPPIECASGRRKYAPSVKQIESWVVVVFCLAATAHIAAMETCHRCADWCSQQRSHTMHRTCRVRQRIMLTSDTAQSIPRFLPTSSQLWPLRNTMGFSRTTTAARSQTRVFFKGTPLSSHR